MHPSITVRHFSVLLILVFMLGWHGRGEAAIVTVNTLTDNAAATCPATCSLRAAITAANAGDVIQFSGAVLGTITLNTTLGYLQITKNLTITGPGANNLAISGNDTILVMQVLSGVTATISGLRIRNGSNSFSGGIYNGGTLTLTRCTVSGNTGSLSGSGGIYNQGTLMLTGSTVSGNTGSFSGGIYNGRTLTLTYSTVSGNTGGVTGGTGGIRNWGTSTVTNSTVSGNTAPGTGGIDNQVTLTVTNSTVSGNTGGVIGGGINNVGALTVTNSTVSGNTAGSGGASTARVVRGVV
jgi:CSLREA domain-containing protein